MEISPSWVNASSIRLLTAILIFEMDKDSVAGFSQYRSAFQTIGSTYFSMPTTTPLVTCKMPDFAEGFIDVVFNWVSVNPLVKSNT